MKAAVLVLLATLSREISSAEYDFVIVGGGPCGLLLANRLSADPNVTVAVIDPGQDARGNPNVTKPTAWLSNLGTSLDWQYNSVPQPGAGNRTLVHHSGRAIGGSSTINGMTYIRGDKTEVDTWEALGNKGWSWDTLYPYYKQVEHFIAPTEAQEAIGAAYVPEYHGEDGPIPVSFLAELDPGVFHVAAAETWNSFGYPTIPDVNGGVTKGYDVWPMTVDRDADLRQDAATVFYWPVADRPNLTLLNGTARRVLWKDGEQQGVAAGVEYIASDSSTQAVSANKEIILSAGAIRTPLVLELSGIGNPSVLTSLGIETQISLPGVGENLQEQPSIALFYQGNVTFTGYGPYGTFATADDLFGDDVSNIASAVKANLSEWARATSDRSGLPVEAVEKVLRLQHAMVFDQNTSIAEFLTTSYGGLLGCATVPLLPFSRGSIHLRSTGVEAMNDPVLDPGFFRAEFDYLVQVTIAKLAQRFWSTEPARSLVAGGAPTGPATTDTEWATYISENVSPNSHPFGTAAMMARELGGVVSPELKVYGTCNLRVVDASILPLQLSGHPTSTLYAIAERAAEFIRGAHQ
ncbi:GMC oxidoreductase [Thozetella sp. PMI_491]|nr:GMC oxidoreductase [Thozetella sp. PMI_491]